MAGNVEQRRSDLVLAYLKDVREHVIIPEIYINGFDLKSLKNCGKNSCRDYLIFWADDCVEGEYYPVPDKRAPKKDTFPAGNGGWYNGRTIWYTDDLEEANRMKRGRRNIIPPVYNPSRENEKPLPLFELIPEGGEGRPLSPNERTIPQDDNINGNLANDSNVEMIVSAESIQPIDEHASDDDSAEEAIQPENRETISNANESSQLTDTNQPIYETDRQLHEIHTTTECNQLIVVTSEPLQLAETNASDNEQMIITQNETVDSFESAIDSFGSANGEETVGAFGNMSNETEEEEEEEEVAPKSTGMEHVRNIKQEPTFAPLNEKDSQAVDEILNSQFENCSESDDDILIERVSHIPQPLCPSRYRTKNNDILSGNLAFAIEDNTGDRAYIVSRGQSFMQVNLTARVVDGLIPFNGHGFRSSSTYDTKFVKVLLIAVIGLQDIRANNLNSLKIEFIKDLFEIRTDGDRMETFNGLIESCRDGIVAGNYY